MLIDAHVHFWQLNRPECHWPTPDLTAIHRDHGPTDWRRAMAGSGVQRAIVVQSQPDDRDTDWLLDMARDEPCIAGVVGWADLAAPTAAARIRHLAGHGALKALRPMLQALPDDDWILQSSLTPAIEAMIAHGLRFEALVLPRHLPHLRRFVARHPDLPVVIDHAAKPDIANNDLDRWRQDIAALADHPQVVCKLSGLVTEAGPDWQPEHLAPVTDHLLSCFGPARLLWGSDWPVLNLASTCSSWWQVAHQLAPQNEAAQAAIFGGNAARFYAVKDKGESPACV